MIKKVLIANRGEIALRIIRACHEMNIDTVAIHSTEDVNNPYVKLATQSICIGPGKSSESYLSIPKILNAALLTNVDAIHPGYGFLSENPEFVALVEKCGIKFIGPSSKVISLMGNKSMAREIMIQNNIPVVPGSKTTIKDIDELKEISKEIGYPVLIKASNGGGGRGMRVVHREEDLEKEYKNAVTESISSFKSDEMYVEKFVENPKHIEFQIIGDRFNNVIHLGERDCSIQRRNQKMIEEAPCSRLNPVLREEMGAIATKVAQVLNYENAGTIEFILDKDDNFYFIEMNTRLQVEHTISEMISGVDIVKEQLRIASGLELKYSQDDICLSGHSIECRINAEDIFNNFSPSNGVISVDSLPGGFNVRFDSFIYNNQRVSPYYDSMIGKLIVKGDSRLDAIKKMRVALDELRLSGIKTNVELHYGILHDLDFLKGNYNTSFLDYKLKNDFKHFMSDLEGSDE